MTATFHFPDRQPEQRTIAAAPHPGDLVEGPEEPGIVWRATAVFVNTVSGEAEVICRPDQVATITGDSPECVLRS
jgi:hypothetical protein